jgi:Tfp pilus assembly PilM family ATPase
LKALIGQLQPKRSPSGFLHAKVSVYPQKRLVRRHTLEAKRIREAGYLSEICSQQFRIEQDKYAISLLNASDGLDFDSGKLTNKDVLFCGLPAEDVLTIQSSLLESGIYPEAIELGSVATLGGVVDFLAQSKSKSPVLVLEIGADMTHSFIVTASGVEASRPVAQGFDAMVPLVQKELGLKDEESARKLFYSNTFDFTGMGPMLTKKLLKELQSSIGFYEVQTGQSVGYVLTTQLSPKLQWLEGSIANALGISGLKLDPLAWLESHQVSVPESLVSTAQDLRWLGLLGLIVQHNHAVHAAVPEEKK